MHTSRRRLICAVLLLVCRSVSAQDLAPRVPDAVRAEAAAGHRVRIIVGLRETAIAEGQLQRDEVVQQRARIRRRADALIGRLPAGDAGRTRRFVTIAFVAADVTPATLLQLERDPDVTSIEEDVPAFPTLAESVPLIGAPAAWQAGATGAGWAVAILDTGVEQTHPFLAGKVVSEACYSNDAGLGGGVSLCPGGATSTTGPQTALNCSADLSGCEHGTHVAGIAAGRGTSFSGVAKDASIVSIQVFTGFDALTCGGPACVGSFTSDQILGLERVLALKDTLQIAAVNLSLGGSQIYTDTASCDAANASRKAAIDNLRSAGIATVVAAGNSGVASGMSAPACISSAISVGSTTKSDQISFFSDTAPFLSLLAPGSSIVSSVPGGGFAELSGTSMAAPHVAGAWTLLKSLLPSASVATLLAAFQTTGLPLVDARVAPSATYPRLRIDTAIGLFLPSVQIDTPGESATVPQPFTMAGWALVRASAAGPGVDAIHVYAINSAGHAILLGAANYGQPRDDVGAAFGSGFVNSGFSLRVNGLAPGTYQLVAYAHNALTGHFDNWATRTVVIEAPAPQPYAAIDTPGPGTTVGPAFTIAGWALDFAAGTGTGVDTIHAYAIPSGSGPAIFLGASSGGIPRGDLAAAFGEQFRNSGYAIAASLAEGSYTLVVYARSTVSGVFTATVQSIVVRAAGAPVMNLDTPADGATVSGTFLLSGWAADLDAPSGPGVDALHVWVVPSGGSAAFAGVASTGGQRDDVGAAFGAQFATAGYSLPLSLSPGTYQIVVYAHSTVTNTFSQWRVATITVNP